MTTNESKETAPEGTQKRPHTKESITTCIIPPCQDQSNPYSTAFKLMVLGYSVIPSGGGKTGKLPLIKWKEYQTTSPDGDQLEIWEAEYKPKLWGIITTDKVAVIDADTQEAKDLITQGIGEPHVITPRGGAHWYIDTPGHPLKSKTKLVPGVDIRGVGGFANIAGGGYQILRMPIPGELIPLDKLPRFLTVALNGTKPKEAIPPEGIPEGQRNDTLFRLAGSMRAAGLEESAIEAALQDTNRERCNPPLTDSEVTDIAKSIARYSPNNGTNNYSIYCPENDAVDTNCHKKVTENITEQAQNITEKSISLAKMIEEWVRQTNGWFDYADIDREFNLVTSKAKHNRLMILKRLEESVTIESHKSNNRLYRFVNTTVRLIDFKAVNVRQPIAVKYPFGIEKLFNTYPGNLIVLAGSADSGKTAFLLNFIRNNMVDFPIYYQSSEMGPEELASRLENFEGIDLQDWNFTAEERSYNFADSIRPDCINIVDYLEFIGGEYWRLGDYLREIHDKLSSGIALVAIQKKRGEPIGRGGDLGLEKPRLYLTMEASRIKIQKAKNWVTADNPNGKVLDFKIVKGCRLSVTNGWQRDDLVTKT